MHWPMINNEFGIKQLGIWETPMYRYLGVRLQVMRYLNSQYSDFIQYICTNLNGDDSLYVPLPKSPKSPLFLAELQSLNWEARASNSSSPDLICSMYSAGRDRAV